MTRWLAVMALSLGIGSCAADDDASPSSLLPASESRLETVPSAFSHGCVYLRVRPADAREMLFLLDSGATASAIDQAAAASISVPTIGETEVLGTLGSERVPLARLERITVGTVRAGPLDVTVSDLSGFLAPPGERVEGILGADFLRELTVRIDFERDEVALGRHRFDPTSEPTRKFVSVPFELDSGIPRFAAHVDGVATAFRLDTGASLFPSEDVYVNVTAGTWERLQETNAGLAPEFHLQATGIGGSTSLPVARIGSIELGAVKIDRPYVIVQPARGYFADPAAAGFFGNNLLEKHGVVALDYPARMLFLGDRFR